MGHERVGASHGDGHHSYSYLAAFSDVNGPINSGSIEVGYGLANHIIDRCLNSFYKRCEAAKNAGGVALFDLIDKGPDILPSNWIYDEATQYFIPPNVVLLPGNAFREERVEDYFGG